MADVVVIGAGIAGLACAYRLHQRGLDVRLVEKGQQVGGAMRTVQREGWRHEWGPNSFLGSAEPIFRLAHDVGLAPVEAKAAAHKRYLFLDGKLQEMPMNPVKLLTGSMVPASAKLKALADPVRTSKPRADESVKEFFTERLGLAFTERFVDAFVSGIYAGDIAKMGMAASFPKIYAFAQSHGSLLRGAIAASRERTGERRRGTFSFPGGLGDLPRAVAAKLGDRVQLGADLLLRREAGRWVVGGEKTRAVVIAAPTQAASKLLVHDAPGLSDELSQLEYNPIVGVHLLYQQSSLPRPLDGFGFLIPRKEGVRMLGCIWSSAMFDVCAPDHAALTIFVGGAHDPRSIEVPDEPLLAQVRDDLARTMGIREAPVDSAIVRHARAIPSYGVRHLSWRERVKQLVQAQPGLALTGNYLEGVSLPDTVAHAERTAQAVAGWLETNR